MTKTNGWRLQENLAEGDVVVLDGGNGTELERCGVPMDDEVWCAAALGTHPQEVRRIHEEYIHAGADVITTNTYSSARFALAMSGLDDNTEAWNRRAVELAIEAREGSELDRPVWVAGSVAPYGSWKTVDLDELRRGFAEQAQILVDSGVDLLIIENLNRPVEVVIAGVEETAGLGVPVWAAVSCMEDTESGRLMLGMEESRAHSDHTRRRAFSPLSEAVQQIGESGSSALLMMHSELVVTLGAVDEIRAGFAGPVGAYPNAGYWQMPNWTFVDEVAPDSFAEQARSWVEAGAQIIGGCCGIGPDHIRALSAAFRAAA